MKGILFTEWKTKEIAARGCDFEWQTRRIVNPQPDDNGLWNDDKFPRSLDSTLTGWNGTVEATGESKEFKPRYKVGENIYIKEPFFIDDDRIIYRYDKYVGDHLICKWGNPRTMAAKQARYFIEITAVRCERLQDISDLDCFKEGIKHRVGAVPPYESFYQISKHPNMYYTPKQAYERLINDINGKGTWERNPFVWVYSFKLKINN